MLLTVTIVFDKRYREDLGRWEQKTVFNGNQVWFKYSLCGESDITTRKKIRGRIRYFDIEKSLSLHPSHSEVQNFIYSLGGYGYNPSQNELIKQ